MNKKLIMPGIQDKKLKRGYRGEIKDLASKKIIIYVYGDTLEEMRERKHLIYETLYKKPRMRRNVWNMNDPAIRLLKIIEINLENWETMTPSQMCFVLAVTHALIKAHLEDWNKKPEAERQSRS